MGLRRLDNVTVDSSETDSTVMEVAADMAVVGIVIPSSITGTTLTIKAGQSESDLHTVYDKDNDSYQVTFTANTYININPQDSVGWRYVQLVMGSSQGAARTIGIQTAPVL